jgi:hypothetical protein
MMKQRLWLLLALWSLLGATLVATVRAHGGGELKVRLAPAGAYAVSVWLNPPAPRVNRTLHFTVGVAAQESGAAVLDAEVQIVMTPLDGATAVLTAPATTAQSANRLFYEADLEPRQSGLYRAEIVVQGKEEGGHVIFEFEVLDASPINWTLVGLLGLALIVALGLWRSRGAPAPSVADRRSRSARPPRAH